MKLSELIREYIDLKMKIEKMKENLKPSEWCSWETSEHQLQAYLNKLELLETDVDLLFVMISCP